MPFLPCALLPPSPYSTCVVKERVHLNRDLCITGGSEEGVSGLGDQDLSRPSGGKGHGTFHEQKGEECSWRPVVGRGSICECRSIGHCDNWILFWANWKLLEGSVQRHSMMLFKFWNCPQIPVSTLDMSGRKRKSRNAGGWIFSQGSGRKWSGQKEGPDNGKPIWHSAIGSEFWRHGKPSHLQSEARGGQSYYWLKGKVSETLR